MRALQGQRGMVPILRARLAAGLLPPCEAYCVLRMASDTVCVMLLWRMRLWSPMDHQGGTRTWLIGQSDGISTESMLWIG